ncbi:hypothetical protein IGI04_024875 [Brassica rapa subsp. trilocularis]|uniref:RNase H type-1 domain-containing protein n=1 Tax=Brassica rapa subsp. trilocularis TaxID=1813537 RepID=A0ABQ7M7Y5_BRACM|nr:hypothetical protein IGI04_024875 [Brassica rapa subsp. trilocularis]
MEYMDMWPSDHRPILLSFSYELNDRGHGRFYFDKRMIGKDGIEEAVKRSWNIGEHSENQSLMDRLANCRKELSRWITRDAQRVPLHHSRRAFPSPVSKREAALQALLWAIEAMDNMKQRNVIFETSSVEVRDVLLNVSHFPELKYLTDHLPRLLQGLGDWSLNHVFSSKNKVAFAIAESVINHHLSQSYVVLGGPRWLAQTVQQESRSV